MDILLHGNSILSVVTVYLLDGSVFIFIYIYSFIASAAKDILLNYVLENPRWGLLDLYVLLTEDIVQFDADVPIPIAIWTVNRQASRFHYSDHTELLLKLLRKKCSVSECVPG